MQHQELKLEPFAVQRRDQGLRPSKETQDETKEKQYRRNKNNRRLYLYRTFALSIANESSHRGQLNSMYMHMYIYIFFWNLRESLKFLTVPGTPYYFYIYIHIPGKPSAHCFGHFPECPKFWSLESVPFEE